MFNSAGSSFRYSNNKLLGGSSPMDYSTHKTMFAGPDPADPSRVLIRKLVQTSDRVWCFEEATVTPNADGGQPSVHTTLYRLGSFDICEDIAEKELAYRLAYRSMPNAVGFSLFTRRWNADSKGTSFSIVENSLNKKSKIRWAEWFRDF